MPKEQKTENPFSQRTLSELLDPNYKIYVYLGEDALRAQFMASAEREGFLFGDGEKPTNRKADEIMAINDDKTISYLGFIGNMAFHKATEVGGKPLLKIDYKSYKNGEINYLYKKAE